MDFINISRLQQSNNVRNEIINNINSIGIGAYTRLCTANEIPNGMLKVFTFKHPDGVTAVTNCAEFSETVWVDSTKQVRGTDYTFDYTSGTVIFESGKEPAGATVITMEVTIVPTGI